MRKTIECVEDFTRDDLEKNYSPLCKHHLFETEDNTLSEVYKRIQAKIYMRLIFIVNKELAIDMSKTIADKHNKDIISMLEKDSGWEYVTLHIDITYLDEESRDFKLKDSNIVGIK